MCGWFHLLKRWHVLGIITFTTTLGPYTRDEKRKIRAEKNPPKNLKLGRINEREGRKKRKCTEEAGCNKKEKRGDMSAKWALNDGCTIDLIR